MSKALFRWLRGELNGYYINKINDSLNVSSKRIVDFIKDFKAQTFEEGKIRDEDLFGIGKFAGVFLPRISLADSTSALYMTDSKIVNGTQFSERGLFLPELELFHYYHLNLDSYGLFYFQLTRPDVEIDINTLADANLKSSLVGDEPLIGYVSEYTDNIFKADGTIDRSKLTKTPPTSGAYNRVYGDQFSFLSEGEDTALDLNHRIILTESEIVDDEEYSERGLYKPPMPDFPDINTLATEDERSSLVGDEEILGFISADETDVLDDEGKVRPEKVLKTRPNGVAYSEFYGNQFLFLSEGEVTYSEVSPSLFMDLYKVLQWIRYNNVSMKSLLKVVEILCPNNLVQIGNTELSVDGNYIYVYYNYNPEVEITYRKQRLALFQYLVEEKFKQVILVENIVSGENL